MDDFIRKNYLAETAKWQKVIGVFYAVCAILVVLLSIGACIAGIVLGQDDESAYFLIAFVLYIPLALLYYYPAKFLFASSKRFKEWVATEDEATLTEGLKNNKSYFKFTGVLTIIGLVGMAIWLIVAIIAGVIAALA